LGINYPLMGSHLQYCNRTGPRKKFNWHMENRDDLSSQLIISV
jgi:hypothetical protein